MKLHNLLRWNWNNPKNSAPRFRTLLKILQSHLSRGNSGKPLKLFKPCAREETRTPKGVTPQASETLVRNCFSISYSYTNLQ